MKQDKNQDSQTAKPNRQKNGGPEMPMPSEEERAALFMLSYEDASAALEKEDPVAVVIATEYILQYSEKVGELLKNGRDYLELLSPTDETPAIERIAMEVVLEAVEEELAGEDVDS